MNIHDSIEKTFRLLEPQKKGLCRLKIENIENLLYHFPVKYEAGYKTVKIVELKEKMRATIFGKITNIKTGKTFHGRTPIARASIEDETGSIQVTWFSQPYIAKMFAIGDLVRIEGTVSGKKVLDKYSIPNPKIEKTLKIPDGSKNTLFKNNNEDTGSETLHPTYPESRGITSNWFYHSLQKVFKSEILDQIEDPIPPKILEKYNLPSLKTALIWIHNPKNKKDALSARKRFAFEEIFLIQIQRQKQRAAIKKMRSYKICAPKQSIKKFISKFPFEMTSAQEKAIWVILGDLETEGSMSRLLEGDVGSGKTAVAAVAVFATTKTKPIGRRFGSLQTAYMVPTEILAKQQFENFIQFFEGSGIQIGLITSSGCFKFPSKSNPKEATKISRNQLIEWVRKGQIPIVVGTHSLIQKSVEFKDLGLVIIDEQHRFGTEQRKGLAQKDNFAPHLLSMTATPIPRTLSLTIYGDLDLTLLDQMPHGRKPIITQIVLDNERDKIYKKVKKEILAGRQAYVICPRINEPDPTKASALMVKSVESETKLLHKKIFPNLKISAMHGKMKPDEKIKVMKEFENGKIDILVSTSVIEVGVNIPNSTMILIEGAERFGLAQLHQLRGRVIRSDHQAYCYIFTNSKTQNAVKRLQALISAKNGFELAEKDLIIRGAGQLVGIKQWGISDIGMDALKNIKMVEAARTEATELVNRDCELKKYPKLADKIESKEQIHFE